MTRRPAWAAGFTLAFALFTLLRYFAAAAAAGIVGTVLLAAAALIALAAGRACLNLLGLAGLDETEKSLFGAALGLGVLALSIFFLCAARLLNAPAVSLVLGAYFLLGAGELRRAAAGVVRPEGLSLLGAGTLAALALAFWTCWVPPHHYDALVYHLALPEAYLRAGGFAAVPHLLFAHFPQNAEMLFTLALLWKSEVMAQGFSWLATALCAGMVLSAREAPPAARLLGAFLFCTHTAVMLLSGAAYVEPFVMLWLTAALFSFLRWRGESRPGRLILSGIFTGLALGAKYYAGIAAILLSLALAFSSRRDVRKGARDLALYAAAVSVVFAPWLIKNWLMVGNPVFPFFYDYFPLTKTGWNAASAHGYFKIMVEYGHAGTFRQDVLALPKLLLSNSLRYGGGMDVLGDLGWEFTFWCLPLAAWAAWGSREMRWLLLYGAAHFAAWFATGVVLRFLTVLAPILCLLGANGLVRLGGEIGPSARRSLGTAIALVTIAHLALFGYVHAIFGSERVLLGLETQDEFLSKRLDYYPCALFAKERLPLNDKILIVGEQRGFYMGQDHMASSVHAPNRFLEWANESATPAELAARLRREGFSHIMVVPSEFRRLAPAFGPTTPEGLARLRALEPEFVNEEFSAPGCVVLGLK